MKVFRCMKKIISFVIFLFVCILFVAPVDAVTITPTQAQENSTPIPTPSKVIDQQINDLKERIASRVAQLKLVERRGVIGTVTDVTDTQITIVDVHNNTRFVDVDELTKFSSPSAKDSFGISDITKSTKLAVLGLYNKQSRRLLARFVEVVTIPKTVHGIVASVDKENFTVDIVAANGEKIIVDIETITRTNAYEKETGVARSGFSKIKEGQRIFVSGFLLPKSSNRLTASRIIVFTDVAPNPKIRMVSPILPPQSTIVPSTGSGNRLTPL